MKILHTADWHLGNYVGPQCDSPTDRTANTMNCLNVLVETAREEQPDVILVAGDVFHQARVWSDRALVEVRVAADYLNKLSAVSPVVVLYGTPNHDGEQQFQALMRMTNAEVYFFTKPELISFKVKSSAIQIAGLPGFDKGHFRAQYPGLSSEEENRIFTQQLAAIVEGLSAQVDPSIPSVLMAHHTVVGSQLDNGQHVFQTNEVVLEAATLDNSSFNMICLGHIHKAQRADTCLKPVYYSGSIDAFTFNDQGHEHGFWIHDMGIFESPITYDHTFIQTPSREFVTCKWNEETVKTYIDAGMNGFAHFEKIQDKVVRVLYECDLETEKALNKKQLEKDLYAAGAYYVSEIRPEKVKASVNRERMHESLAIEDCLKKYLEEKNYDSTAIPHWIEFAQPIISQVQASQPAGGQTGIFLPVEISVRNYRSYAEETLSFQDIHFAMVNGVNGSGKSSLFMDALVDCLYEEPREGELTGWIRSGEKSGSISFTFQLGEHTYRVTRTRQRSGKATLSLSRATYGTVPKEDATDELYSSRWEDQSCERMNDTQKKIIDLLGMDADTFRSCVLIMQDQYGRFMEAKPEDRMSVLASLLGLGMYEQLERLTKETLRDTNRELKRMKEDASVLEVKVEALDAAKKQAKEVNEEIKIGSTLAVAWREKLAKMDAKLVAMETAEMELLQVRQDIEKKNEQKNEKQNKLSDLQRDIKATEDFLLNEPALTDAHNEYQKLQGELIAFGEQEKQAEDKRQQLAGLRNEITSLEAEDKKLRGEVAELQTKLEKLPDMLDELNELNGVEHHLEEMEGKKVRQDELTREKQEQTYAVRVAEEKVARLNRQTEMLKTVQCVDIERAQCAFLKEAKEAAGQMNDAETNLVIKRRGLNKIKNEIVALNYNPEVFLKITQQTRRYHELKQKVQSAEADKRMIDIRTDRIGSIRNSIDEKRTVRTKLNEEMTWLEVNLGNIQNIKKKLSALTGQEKQFSQLPVAKAYIENAAQQRDSLQEDLNNLNAEIKNLHEKAERLRYEVDGVDELKFNRKTTAGALQEKEAELSELNKKLGSLDERIRSLEGKQEKLQKIIRDIEDTAKKVSRLTVLAEAFGQDGIPHQIIGDIVPELETSANEILGQMTGGRMRLEFRTERQLKSNKAKKVATLDIVIIDIENGELPYLARSGGQKVRAALAVSFALAMVKASRVGLQLGMMFVDEPPFLDEEGKEAYCMALGAIHDRYPDMRIVAISHDRDMKARFPQQISIVKTENGSEVRI